MTSLADIAGRLRHSQVSAAQIRHAGQIILEVGDVSRPIDVHSMRKSILSVLVGLAYDRRDINLDTTLRELDIDDTPALSAEEKSATIKDLLTARSGVHLPVADGGTLGRPSRGSHPPGTFWCYNNWDFNVLGHVYERITGRSVFVAFEHELAGPLDMTDWDTYRHGSYRYRADILGGTPDIRTTSFICRPGIPANSDSSVWTTVSRMAESCSRPSGLRAALAQSRVPIGRPDCWVCTAVAGG
ncbi:MAG: serine hydrolase [Mycobacterium sp.]